MMIKAIFIQQITYMQIPALLQHAVYPSVTSQPQLGYLLLRSIKSIKYVQHY